MNSTMDAKVDVKAVMQIEINVLVKHVIAQKMVAFWILFAVYIYSVGAGKYLLKKHE